MFLLSMTILFFFFFSSRRRHTRFDCDWSSDVCSSDLDNRYMLGEAPELRNFFVAAGFNSVGIASAAGAGKALAEWIVGGEPSMDLWDVDIRRFMPFQGNARYLRERTTEVVGLLYAMHWPFRQPASARGVRRSALHDRLAARGAVFGVVAGWGRAASFAAPPVQPPHVHT